MNNSLIIKGPVEHLAAAVAKGLTLSVESNFASGTYREGGQMTIEEQALYLRNNKRHPEGIGRERRE